METQQVRDFITSKKMKKKMLSLKGFKLEEINVQFCLPTFRLKQSNSQKISTLFPELFPFPPFLSY